MEKLKIISKDNYLYELKSESDQIYKLNLEFLDLETLPTIEDCIYMNEKLLDKKYEGYSTSYTFGVFENKYGKNNIHIEDVDVIRVKMDGIEIYLKRLYG